MEKDVHLFEILKTIFLFKIFELGKAIFEVAENSNDLNRFDFELNLTRRHYSRGLLIIAQPPLLGAAPRACTLLTRSHQPWVCVCRRLSSQAPPSLFHTDVTPDPHPSSSLPTATPIKATACCRAPFSLSPPSASLIERTRAPTLLPLVHIGHHRCRHPAGNRGRHRRYSPPSVSSTTRSSRC
jgi:hypothetical protein